MGASRSPVWPTGVFYHILGTAGISTVTLKRSLALPGRAGRAGLPRGCRNEPLERPGGGVVYIEAQIGLLSPDMLGVMAFPPVVGRPVADRTGPRRAAVCPRREVVASADP